MMGIFAKSLKQDLETALPKADHLAGIAYSLARIADNLEAAERNRANVIELLDVIEKARLELECGNPGMAYQILVRAHEPRYGDTEELENEREHYQLGGSPVYTEDTKL